MFMTTKRLAGTLIFCLISWSARSASAEDGDLMSAFDSFSFADGKSRIAASFDITTKSEYRGFPQLPSGMQQNGIFFAESPYQDKEHHKEVTYRRSGEQYDYSSATLKAESNTSEGHEVVSSFQRSIWMGNKGVDFSSASADAAGSATLFSSKDIIDSGLENAFEAKEVVTGIFPSDPVPFREILSASEGISRENDVCDGVSCVRISSKSQYGERQVWLDPKTQHIVKLRVQKGESDLVEREKALKDTRINTFGGPPGSAGVSREIVVSGLRYETINGTEILSEYTVTDQREYAGGEKETYTRNVKAKSIDFEPAFKDDAFQLTSLPEGTRLGDYDLQMTGLELQKGGRIHLSSDEAMLKDIEKDVESIANNKIDTSGQASPLPSAPGQTAANSERKGVRSLFRIYPVVGTVAFLAFLIFLVIVWKSRRRNQPNARN